MIMDEGMRRHLWLMVATDMRSLSREARDEGRVQVIRPPRAGHSFDAIAAQTGLSRTGVLDICTRHETAGAKALRDARPWRRRRARRLISRTRRGYHGRKMQPNR